MRESLKCVEIARPVDTVYSQYARFGSFPELMKDVVEVRPVDERH